MRTFAGNNTVAVATSMGHFQRIAGDVPVEFVMVAKETELAIGAISELVSVSAGRQVITGAAKVNPDAIAKILSVVGLRIAVAAHA